MDSDDMSPSQLIKYHLDQLLEVLRGEQDPEPPPTGEIVFKVKPRYIRLKLPDDAKEVIVLAVTEKSELQLPAWEFPVDQHDDQFKLTHTADRHFNRLHVMQAMAEDTKCTMFAVEEVEPNRKRRHRKILRTTDIEEDGELSVNMIVDEVKERDYKFCSLLKYEDEDTDIQMPPQEFHMNLTVKDNKALPPSNVAKVNNVPSLPGVRRDEPKTPAPMRPMPQQQVVAPSLIINRPAANIVTTNNNNNNNVITIPLMRAIPLINVAPPPQSVVSEQLKCMKCKVTFASKSALSCHLCPTEQKCTFVCKTCNGQFVHYKEFVRHLKTHVELKPIAPKLAAVPSQQPPPLQIKTIKPTSFSIPQEIPYCKTCKALFPSERELSVHMESHNAPLKCDREFTAASDSCNNAANVLLAEEPAASDLICVLCGESFQSMRRFQSHKLTHSSAAESTVVINASSKRDGHVCGVCSRAFVSAAALGTHSQLHAMVSYVCSSCGTRFQTKDLLDDHDKTNCAEKLICEHCGTLCPTALALKEHAATHAEQAFACNICSTKFYSKRRLNSHRRIHAPRKYLCDVCQMSFYAKSHYQRHMKHHAKQRGTTQPPKVTSFCCSLCPDSYGSVATLVEHYGSAHPLTEFKCTTCDANFTWFHEIRDHFRYSHKQLSIFCCRICGDVFSDQAEFKRHKNVHSSKAKKVSQQPGPSKWCPSCKKYFATGRDFGDHLLSNEDCRKRLNETLNAANAVECEECRKTFSASELLEVHAIVHKSDPPYSCVICSDRFDNASDFDDHVHAHRRNSESCDAAAVAQVGSSAKSRRQYVCKVCGRPFLSLSSLTVHSYLHGGEKPFKCTECGLGFSHYSKLSKHQLMHKGEKFYRCAVCWKAFWAKHSLLMHVKNHHGGRGSDGDAGFEATQHQCTVCGRSFTKQSNLSNHMRRHSGEKGLLKKKFPCRECKRTFTTKAHLIIHEQTHNGIGLVCPECGKKFTTLTWLQYHMRVHTGESPTCSVCSRSFATRRSMEEHLSTHDRGDFACETCGAKLSSSRYLQAHVKLNHTGEVPVVCGKCGLGFPASKELDLHEAGCSQRMGEHARASATNEVNEPPREDVVLQDRNVVVGDNNYAIDDEIDTATSSLQVALHQAPMEIIQEGIQPSFSGEFAGTFLQNEEHDNSNAMIQEVYYNNNPDGLILTPTTGEEGQQTVMPLNSLVIDNNSIQLPPGFVLDGSQDVVVQIVSDKQLEDLLNLNRM